MPIPEFSQAQYLSTMISPMTNVTETADPPVDIWPTVRMLVTMNLIPKLVAEKHLIEAVYRNKTGTYDHVLIPTSRPDIFVCVIVNNTEKLDFRIIHEWDYADEKLAYLAPANSNDFWVEILAGGKLTKTKTEYNDLGKSLEESGYHHICMHVTNLNNVVAELKNRGVTIVGQTFYLDAIHRNLAFIRDPWGNMIEFAEVVKK